MCSGERSVSGGSHPPHNAAARRWDEPSRGGEEGVARVVEDVAEVVEAPAAVIKTLAVVAESAEAQRASMLAAFEAQRMDAARAQIATPVARLAALEVPAPVAETPAPIEDAAPVEETAPAEVTDEAPATTETLAVDAPNETVEAVDTESTPEARPDAHSLHPDTSFAHPDTPEARPDAHSLHPDTSVAHPDTPEARPDTSFAHPDTSEAHPDTPVAHPDIAAVQADDADAAPSAGLTRAHRRRRAGGHRAHAHAGPASVASTSAASARARVTVHCGSRPACTMQNCPS